jgi:hypothetical protein
MKVKLIDIDFIVIVHIVVSSRLLHQALILSRALSEVLFIIVVV